MYKMAIIGETESILAFRAVGFDTFIVSREQAGEELRKHFDSGLYAVIFVSELIAQGQSEYLADCAARSFPIITVVPTVRERMFTGLESLSRISIRATGTDLISKL